MNMSWELQMLLAVAVVIGFARVAGSFIRLVKRIIFWARAKKYNYAYLPHAGSDKPWRRNEWKPKVPRGLGMAEEETLS